MRILILGGAGGMAEIAELDLMESKGVKSIVLAGRSIEQLKRRKAKLLKANKKSKARLEIQQIDIKSPYFVKQLKRAKADVLINSTWYMLNTVAMAGAIKAKLSYIDLGGLYYKTREQLKMKAAAKKAGVTCVLGMGETPGTMNVLARQMGTQLDRIDRVDLRCGAVETGSGNSNGNSNGNDEWVPPYAIQTILDEVGEPPVVQRKGKITTLPPLSEEITFDLPKPIGRSTGYYTLHSEIASLPRYFKKKGVKQMDFAYAYGEETLEVVGALVKAKMASKQPIKVNDVSISPYQFIGLVDKQLMPKSEEDVPDKEAIRVEAWGKRRGKRAKVIVDMVATFHRRWKRSAGTAGTGIPPSIIAQWIASGKLDKPGVWAPEDIIDPIPFFKALATQGRGMHVYQQINRGTRKRLA